MTRYFTGDQSSTAHRPAPADGLDRQLDTANAASLAESPTTANLVVVGGPNDGVVLSIPNDGLTLGRLHDNDVVIDDPWVSRRHAEIISTHDGYRLRDLASSNGTFLTDRLIDASDYGLHDGDHIRLGRSDVQLVFLVFRFSISAMMKIAPISRFNVAPTRKMAGAPGAKGIEAVVAPKPAWRARQAVKRAYLALSGWDTIGPDMGAARKEGESAEELVQGEVRLNVKAGDDVRLLFQFLHELREEPEFSVLRLSGGPKQDIAVWLGLAEQIALKPLLSRIKFVSEVTRGADPPTGGRAAEKVFNIRLAI